MTNHNISQQTQTVNTGEHPFVSVMVLCYNYGHLLPKALEACAAQSFRDFEVVMIDNGSTDCTKQVYEDFCAKYPDIKSTYLFVTPNKGPTNGWNEGLKVARGEYVMFNDADDWMEPDCLEKLVGLARKTGSDRVAGQYREVFPDGTAGKIRGAVYRKGHKAQWPLLQGVLFRRSVILENELFLPLEYLIIYDVWFVFKFAICEKHPRVNLYEVIYNYYFNPDSGCVKITRWGAEKLYKDFMVQSVIGISEVLKEVTDKELYYGIMYETLKTHYYSLILMAYEYTPHQDAVKFYKRSHALIQENMPDYWKNPLIWSPLTNGYGVKVSVMMMALVIMEKLHLSFLWPAAAKVYANYGSSR